MVNEIHKKKKTEKAGKARLLASLINRIPKLLQSD